jgi:MFS family permease
VKDKRTLWRHADFMKLWTGQSISVFGTAITQLALPLTAIVILKATPFEIGLLGTVEFLPFLLVGLPAGVWVDRLSRRRILIVADIGRAITLGSIPVAYKLGALHILQLYVVAFLTGILTVFFDVAYQAYLPSLVGREELVEGNGKLEISRSGAQLAGPGIAGPLIQLVKAPMAIAVDALSYIASVISIFVIRKREAPVEPAGSDGEPAPKMRKEIGDGLRYVLGNRYLRSIAASTASMNLFGNVMFAVLLLFAVRVLGLSPGAIGIILTIGGIGFLGGAFVSGRVSKRLGVGRTILISAIVSSLAGLLIPFATRSTAWPLLISALLVSGFGGVVYNVNQVSLRQAITPERMQGRMNATMRFMVWGTIPIGSLAGGILGSTIGLRPTLWVGAIGGAFGFMPLLFSPVPGLAKIPEPSRVEGLSSTDEGIVEVGHVPHLPEETPAMP